MTVGEAVIDILLALWVVSGGARMALTTTSMATMPTSIKGSILESRCSRVIILVSIWAWGMSIGWPIRPGLSEGFSGTGRRMLGVSGGSLNFGNFGVAFALVMRRASARDG